MSILPRRPDVGAPPDRHFLHLRICENGDGDALCVSHVHPLLPRSLNDADDFGGDWIYVALILVTWTECDGELWKD